MREIIINKYDLEVEKDALSDYAEKFHVFLKKLRRIVPAWNEAWSGAKRINKEQASLLYNSIVFVYAARAANFTNETKFVRRFTGNGRFEEGVRLAMFTKLFESMSKADAEKLGDLEYLSAVPMSGGDSDDAELLTRLGDYMTGKRQRVVYANFIKSINLMLSHA